MTLVPSKLMIKSILVEWAGFMRNTWYFLQYLGVRWTCNYVFLQLCLWARQFFLCTAHLVICIVWFWKRTVFETGFLDAFNLMAFWWENICEVYDVSLDISICLLSHILILVAIQMLSLSDFFIIEIFGLINILYHDNVCFISYRRFITFKYGILSDLENLETSRN